MTTQEIAYERAKSHLIDELFSDDSEKLFIFDSVDNLDKMKLAAELALENLDYHLEVEKEGFTFLTDYNRMNVDKWPKNRMTTMELESFAARIDTLHFTS